MLFIENDHNS